MQNRDTSFSYAILSIFVRNNCKRIEETCNYFLTFFWGVHFFVLTRHSYLELPIIGSFFCACGVQKVSNLQKNIAVEVCNNYVENELLLKIMSVALKIIWRLEISNKTLSIFQHFERFFSFLRIIFNRCLEQQINKKWHL